MKFSAARLYGDDRTDCAALDEELFDDVVLDPLDGQPDVDVFGEGPVTGDVFGKGPVTGERMKEGDDDRGINIGVSVCMFACA